jgi:murein DD-endopeptidase MepM/ murein hydrolase activator NlpD
VLKNLNRIAIPERIGVIRHRVSSRLVHLNARHRSLLAVGVALAVIGLGTLAANAAVSGGDSPPENAAAITAQAEDSALPDREAAANRADRAERPPPPPKAEEPQESPEPSPTEAEPEPEPEPAEAEQAEAEQAETEQAETEQAPAEQADWVHPMPGAATTSCYGMRWGVLHAGVDLASPHGTPIRAVGAGTVTDAGWVFGGYGISVVIDHRNGVYTHYAHMSDVAVSPGQSVSPGQTIGYEGSTGDSTGPHLHFEVHQGMWNQIEPTSWMRDRGISIGGC